MALAALTFRGLSECDPGSSRTITPVSRSNTDKAKPLEAIEDGAAICRLFPTNAKVSDNSKKGSVRIIVLKTCQWSSQIVIRFPKGLGKLKPSEPALDRRLEAASLVPSEFQSTAD